MSQIILQSTSLPTPISVERLRLSQTWISLSVVTAMPSHMICFRYLFLIIPHGFCGDWEHAIWIKLAVAVFGANQLPVGHLLLQLPVNCVNRATDQYKNGWSVSATIKMIFIPACWSFSFFAALFRLMKMLRSSLDRETEVVAFFWASVGKPDGQLKVGGPVGCLDST